MSAFRLEVGNLWKGALAWALSLSAVTFMLLAFFPSMGSESMRQLAQAKLEGISPVLLKVLGLGIMPDFSIITVYFGYTLQFLNLAVMIYAVQKASAMLIREESEGTIEYLYAKPLSRTDIYLQKLLATAALFAALVLLVGLTTIAGYLLFSPMAPAAALCEVSALFGGTLYAGLVYLSAGAALSAFLTSGRVAPAAATGLVFGSFLLGMLSATVPALDLLHFASPLDWIRANKLLDTGLTAGEWAAGGLIIVGCLVCAGARYARKDLRV
jgi:ABC-2 type transport system permease protein